MSVRATGKIVGELVVVSGLPNSPHMVVKAFDEAAKLITTVWFSDCNNYQEGVFPAAALDRAEPKNAPKGKTTKGRKTAAKSAAKR